MLSTAWLAWGWLPQNWVLEESLPLHLSDVLRVVVAIALIWRPQWALAVIYYWGLTLNLQSIITADLNYYDYPTLEFIMYWLLHITVLVAPLVFIFGLGYRPTWRGYGLTLAITVGWAAVTFIVNTILDTNYGYLNGAPDGSILDALGLVADVPPLGGCAGCIRVGPDDVAVDPSEKTATVTTNQQTGRQTAVAARAAQISPKGLR